MQAEYETWRDGPAGVPGDSRTAELLEQVCDVDLDALDVELPRRFGRDGQSRAGRWAINRPRDTMGDDGGRVTLRDLFTGKILEIELPDLINMATVYGSSEPNDGDLPLVSRQSEGSLHGVPELLTLLLTFGAALGRLAAVSDRF